MLKPTPSPILLGTSGGTQRPLSSSTSLELSQRAHRSEGDVIALRKKVADLEQQLLSAAVTFQRAREEDTFYYIPPVAVLPAALKERHRDAIDALVSYAVMYRESFSSQSPIQQSTRIVAQLQQENAMLRATIVRLQQERDQMLPLD